MASQSIRVRWCHFLSQAETGNYKSVSSYARSFVVFTVLLFLCSIVAAEEKSQPLNQRAARIKNIKDGTTLVAVDPTRFGARIAPDHHNFGLLEKLSPFWLAPDEVTNAQFSRFIAATGYHCVDDKWSVNAEVTGPCAPVLYISRDDADAYLRWAGLRLPSWAEIELAAQLGCIERSPLWNWAFNFHDRGINFNDLSEDDWFWFQYKPGAEQFSLTYLATITGASFPCLARRRTDRNEVLSFRCAASSSDHFEALSIESSHETEEIVR